MSATQKFEELTEVMRPQDLMATAPGCGFETHAATLTINKVAAKQTRLGEVEAADEHEAIEKLLPNLGSTR